jgi:hypothetical protein
LEEDFASIFRVEGENKSAEAGGKLGYSNFFLGSLFGPEDGGDIFLRNVGISKIHVVTTHKNVPFSCKFTAIFLIYRAPENYASIPVLVQHYHQSHK